MGSSLIILVIYNEIYIEKYLDIDYYLKWHALTGIIAGMGNNGHNFLFVNDFNIASTTSST